MRLTDMTIMIARGFGLSEQEQVLDWGGGDGLLVRLLRDAGLDAYHHDRYADNLYAAGFEGDPTKRYSMVTAFEVF